MEYLHTLTRVKLRYLRGMLYSAGEIRKIGRVDHGDAFLDSHEIERDKGITIFSKQAVMRFRDTEFTFYLTLPVTLTFLPKWSVL